MAQKNTPFSIQGAAQNIRKRSQDNQNAAGVSAKPSITKKTPTPTSQPSMTAAKAWSAVKAGADTIGLDGKFGFQNTFNSIKGIGKIK